MFSRNASGNTFETFVSKMIELYGTEKMKPDGEYAKNGRQAFFFFL